MMAPLPQRYFTRLKYPQESSVTTPWDEKRTPPPIAFNQEGDNPIGKHGKYWELTLVPEQVQPHIYCWYWVLRWDWCHPSFTPILKNSSIWSDPILSIRHHFPSVRSSKSLITSLSREGFPKREREHIRNPSSLTRRKYPRNHYKRFQLGPIRRIPKKLLVNWSRLVRNLNQKANRRPNPCPMSIEFQG